MHSPAVKLRLELDREATRLRTLDIENPREGVSRLLEWTIAEGLNDMARIAGSKNGVRKEPGKKKAAPAQSQASQLSEALAFVAVAGTKSDQPYKMHVILNNGFAIMSDGQMTAGFPIVEKLACCPHLELLASTILKCGTSLAITELESGNLSLVGEKIKAIIPCLSFQSMPDALVLAADVQVAAIDDRLKTAFSVCGTLVSEASQQVVEAALLLEANQCTSTNRKVMMQYWHGIDLPPGLVVPKIFAAAVCRIKSPLKGFGWKPGVSITFHFENGGWLKTLLYEDQYPSIASIIDKPFNAIPVPVGLFDAIATVSNFNDDGTAVLDGDYVCSHVQENVGAEYTIEGLNGNICLKSDQTKLIAPFVTKIDLNSYPDRAFFVGENMRGLILGIELAVVEAPRTESGFERREVETMDQWRANGSDPNTIPF